MTSELLYILGAESFVGKALTRQCQSKGLNCRPIGREIIDFLRPETFGNLDFRNSKIIDCITVNNRVGSDIMECNYYGFSRFLSYLKEMHYNAHYAYLSTVSVLNGDIIATSDYVRSKKMAEDYLTQSGLEYQILRLSYPIGRGENTRRLISSIIALLRLNKPVSVHDIKLNLNDIADVSEAIIKKLFTVSLVFISSNKYYPLRDIVLFLKMEIGSESEISILEAAKQAEPLSDDPFVPSRTIYETLREMI